MITSRSTGLLTKHHRLEDAELWPMLRTRAPASTAELNTLEAQHSEIDSLIDIAGDRTLARIRRAGRDTRRARPPHGNHATGCQARRQAGLDARLPASTPPALRQPHDRLIPAAAA